MAAMRQYFCPHCKKRFDSTYGEVLYIGEPIETCPHCQGTIIKSNTTEWEFLSPVRRKFYSIGFTTKSNIFAKICMAILLIILIPFTYGISLLLMVFFYIPSYRQFKSSDTQDAIKESIARTSEQSYVELLKQTLEAEYYPLTQEEKDEILNQNEQDELQVKESDEPILEKIGELAAKDMSANTLEITQQHVNDPEYGLTPNKPIYCNQLSGSKKYLASLRSAAGEQLDWERVGSYAMEDISGMVDIYVGKLSGGSVYATIYINMYSETNSSSAPNGFIVLDDE